MTEVMKASEKPKTSSKDTKFPIAIPQIDQLTLSDTDFEAVVAKTELHPQKSLTEHGQSDSNKEVDKAPTEVSTNVSGFSDLEIISKQDVIEHPGAAPIASENPKVDLPDKAGEKFVEGLKSWGEEPEPTPESMENKMLTENADVAHRSTKDPLVDLFFELEDVVSSPILRNLLEAAWSRDKDATVKIIFNARSIHLGKGSRTTFYRCCGWLAETHPKTLLANLQWLCQKTIDNPKPTSEQESSKDSVIEQETADRRLTHGYWKDLLNILTLAVSGELTMLSDPATVLNVRPGPDKRKRNYDPEKAKAERDQRKVSRHETAVKLFNSDPFYRLLHLQVARLFAAQLDSDKTLLDSGKKEDLGRISLCAKWAPTLGGAHDARTFITSSIAEILYPRSQFPEFVDQDRETYLKNARERYRCCILSPLRKAIAIVEHNITDKTYEKVRYQRVPSLAMKRYSSLFIMKDTDRFEAYLDSVLSGKKSISGATLLPSTLVSAACSNGGTGYFGMSRKNMGQALAERHEKLRMKTIDGQWGTLVQRIKDSGKLSSAIAVCDVSGSMSGPRFPDGTCPMDSAIGLSLLLAECTEPPFGGHFISFSSNPTLQVVGGPDDKRSFLEKIQYIKSSDWGMNTDLTAVFMRLILPMAVKNKLKQEDMVKTVFIFSDMQFDSACASHDTPANRSTGGSSNPRRVEPVSWSTSYERIKSSYEEAGYEMPHIVFWNLAGGRAGYGGVSGSGDPTAPKPVTADEKGTSLVSGYSQGQLKVFLEGAGFEEPEETEEITEEDEDGDEDMEDEDGVAVKISKKKVKQEQDPSTTVKKAISHPAYGMLKTVD